MNIEEVKKFYEHLKGNQLPEEVNQEAQGFGSKKYTADMWTLDVCKCLLNMDCKDYHYKPKLRMFETLKKIKDDADTICIGEVGRGLDILIANMLKKWKVICYDHNPIYNKYLSRKTGKAN